MNKRTRVEKLEAAILPRVTDRTAWFNANHAKIERRMDAIWQGVCEDYFHLVELLKNGGYVPMGIISGRFALWPSRNNCEINPIPKGTSEIARQIDHALREYFAAPEGDDDEIHAKPGETWPLTHEDAIPFLESHAVEIMGWMSLQRFKESDYFKQANKTLSAND